MRSHVDYLHTLLGSSTVIRHVRQLVMKVCNSDHPILIHGEPGSGKRLMAEFIHSHSSRKDGEFLRLECHKHQKDILQKIQSCTKGTIYLEEIAGLPIDIQKDLYQILTNMGCFDLEENELVSSGPRIIASSSENLDKKINCQEFFEKLYYRLASSVIYIPPLRDRKEDIPDLVNYYLEQFSKETGKEVSSISQDALTAFNLHDWPSNIHELRNLLYKIILLKQSNQIDLPDLPLYIRKHVAEDLDSYYEKCLRDLANNEKHVEQNDTTTPPPTPTLSIRPTTPTQFKSRQVVSTSFYAKANTSRRKNMEKTGENNKNEAYNSRDYQTVLPSFDECPEIEQFVKKDFNLGQGIDFYRVVEEFENLLIAAALKRTKNNKNRAAQLLAMNRTTLVEKLRKRACRNIKSESSRIKRNSAFTIFDGLGKKFL